MKKILFLCLLVGGLLVGCDKGNKVDNTEFHPFGLDQKNSIKELKKLTNMKPYRESKIIFEATTVPNPSRLMEKYTLLAIDGLGLCKIVAETPLYTQQQLSDFKETLIHVGENIEEKYKEIPIADRDTKELIWDLEGKNKANLRAIQMQPHFVPDGAFMTLTYTFSNMPECEVKAKEIESSAF